MYITLNPKPYIIGKSPSLVKPQLEPTPPPGSPASPNSRSGCATPKVRRIIAFWAVFLGLVYYSAYFWGPGIQAATLRGQSEGLS